MRYKATTVEPWATPSCTSTLYKELKPNTINFSSLKKGGGWEVAQHLRVHTAFPIPSNYIRQLKNPVTPAPGTHPCLWPLLTLGFTCTLPHTHAHDFKSNKIHFKSHIIHQSIKSVAQQWHKLRWLNLMCHMGVLWRLGCKLDLVVTGL